MSNIILKIIVDCFFELQISSFDKLRKFLFTHSCLISRLIINNNQTKDILVRMRLERTSLCVKIITKKKRERENQ